MILRIIYSAIFIGRYFQVHLLLRKSRSTQLFIFISKLHRTHFLFNSTGSFLVFLLWVLAFRLDNGSVFRFSYPPFREYISWPWKLLANLCDSFFHRVCLLLHICCCNVSIRFFSQSFLILQILVLNYPLSYQSIIGYLIHPYHVNFIWLLLKRSMLNILTLLFSSIVIDARGLLSTKLSVSASMLIEGLGKESLPFPAHAKFNLLTSYLGLLKQPLTSYSYFRAHIKSCTLWKWESAAIGVSYQIENPTRPGGT